MLTTMFIPIKPALKVKPEISALDGFKPTMRPKIMIIIGIPTVEPKFKNQCMACTNIFYHSFNSIRISSIFDLLDQFQMLTSTL